MFVCICAYYTKSPSVLHVSGDSLKNSSGGLDNLGTQYLKKIEIAIHGVPPTQFHLFYITVKIITPSTTMSLEVRNLLHIV